MSEDWRLGCLEVCYVDESNRLVREEFVCQGLGSDTYGFCYRLL